MAENAPKIIVDDDWKNQAQAEKAKLEEQARKEQEEQPENNATGQRKAA